LPCQIQPRRTRGTKLSNKGEVGYFGAQCHIRPYALL
jgi:hypothetical protein